MPEREGGCCPNFSVFSTCRCICGQLAVLLFSSDWVTTGTFHCAFLSLFCLVEPFFSEALSFEPFDKAFLHIALFVTQQRDVTQSCHSGISWRDPVQNKTREKRISACDGLQIGLPPRSLFRYRCTVRNKHCTLRLL